MSRSQFLKNTLTGLFIGLCLGWVQARSIYETSVSKTEIQQSNTTRTVIKTIKDKSGREKTVTTIDSKIDTRWSATSVTPAKSAKNNISGLVGNDFSKVLPKPIYGVSLTREFIGPVTLGAFGLTNGVIGVSVGINF